MQDHILVIDEGTTSTRAIVFDRAFKQVALAQQEVPLSYPQDGWVEQDGESIWAATLAVCRHAIADAGGPSRIAAIGITNQRETTLVWERKSGSLIGPAIVWQDRRTAGLCDSLRAVGHEALIQRETGLLPDAYFSATKIAWLIDAFPGARAAAEAGELAFGTVDSFLIWRLTNGTVHATDATNASRTLLARLALGSERGWSEPMRRLFGIPAGLLPDIRHSADDFGVAAPGHFGVPLPILSAMGDQQAALVGQGCLAPGQAKITFGTGAFLVANTGNIVIGSPARLLATSAYELPGAEALGLEGSIFNAGTVIKWLRDDLKLITNAADSEAIAASLPGNGGVYFVPAFTGLGAPHWNSDARGVICGLTRAAKAAHVVRAGLEAVAYQTHDLLGAFVRSGLAITELRVDGGMSGNDWLMQFVADICDVPVFRPDYQEMTALGAAAAAAMKLGWTSPAEWAARQVPGRRFAPSMDPETRRSLLEGWRRALQRAL